MRPMAGTFGFDSSLPVSALAAGADLVVHSVHKSLGGLGQSAHCTPKVQL